MLLRPVTALLIGCLLGARAQDPPPAPPAAFSFEGLKARARALAQLDYAAPAEDDLPEWLAELDYDGYQRLRLRPEHALWAADELPFRISFAHRGYLFRSRVRLHEVADGQVRELRYGAAQFRGAPEGHPPAPDDLGYAGFAVDWDFGADGARDEIASFLGASYFRLVGDGQVYGASARALAIDTATPQGEEFPHFTEFWIERPAPGATQLTLHALLDSPALTGACRFVLTPGAEVTADVTACFFARRDVDKLGLAPLTSMFLFGEDSRHRLPDYRPEVHDSDGLLIDDGHGEWLWRPLNNPLLAHRITRFPAQDPAGFGLVQRDRAHRSYEDPGARFETRPSLWVTPRGAWGKGAVELVEIPTPAEWNDNIVAYWVPEEPLREDGELCLEYRLGAHGAENTRPPHLRTRATRLRPGPGAPLFVLDFEGPAQPAGAPPLRADISATRGTPRDVTLEPNAVAGGYRCAFKLEDAGSEPLQLRVRLLRGELPASETLVLDWTAP